MADILIKGGLVVDGRNAAYKADIAVEGSRISAIGTGLGPGRRTIDARGSFVVPGFVDLHTHSDFTLPVRPEADAKLLQGVTTDVTGNCGFSPYPLEDVEGARQHGVFFEPKLQERWGSLDAFARAVTETRPGINVAPLVGLGAIRLSVMGEARSAPSDEQLTAMRQLLTEQLLQGAFGASSGLIYPPGSFAAPAELHALAQVIRAHRRLYATHIRNEAREVSAAVEEALELATVSGCAVQISHHKAFGEENWGKTEATLARIDEANLSGQDVSVDAYPYIAGSTSLAALLDPEVLDGGEALMKRRLADPIQREHIARRLDTDGFVSLEHVLIAALPSQPSLVGRKLVEVAADHALAPSEMLIRLLEVDGRDALMVVFGMSEHDVRRVLSHPRSIVASDGWTMAIHATSYAHPRNFAFSARLLGHYVRDENIMPLEHAIAKLTAMPAARVGLPNRGQLQKGWIADIVVFNLDEIEERATFAAPCQHPRGFNYVLVGGQVAVQNGTLTGVRAGEILRAEG